MFSEGAPSARFPRKLFFWYCAAFAGGIVFAHLLGLSFQTALLLVAASLATIFLVRRSGNYYWLLLIAFAAGALWLSADAASRTPFPYQDGEAVVIEGMAAENSTPDQERAGVYSFRLHSDTINGEEEQRLLYVYADDGQQVLYGEAVTVSGKVMAVQQYANANAFDYAAYLERQGISGSVSAAYGGTVVKSGQRGGNPLLRLASWLNVRFAAALAYLPLEQQSLLRGVFLGDKGGLDYQDKQRLSRTGIMHAFSVSGLHVGYIVLLGIFLLGRQRRGRWWRLGILSAVILLYAAVTGGSPPVLRASVMAIVGLAAVAIDEKADPYVALGLAALVCLLWKPLLLFDAGFQLSFVAVLGIIYLTPLFGQLLPGRGALSKTFAVTFAASCATMPLVAYYFYLLSLSALVIAPLFVLGVGIVVMLSFVGLLFAVISVPLATLPLFGGGALMEAVYRLSAWVGSWSTSALAVAKPTVPLVLACYGILLVLPWVLKRCGKLLTWLLVAAALVLLVLPWGNFAAPTAAYDGAALEVTFVDVGQGDCALIRTPAGQDILLDGGGKTNSPDWVGENVLLPYLRSRGISQLDFLISSHPHDDHVDGLICALHNLPVAMLLTTEAFPGVALQEQLEAAARADGTKIVAAAAGKRYRIEENLYLTVYSPQAGDTYSADEANNGSLVCKLTYEQFSLLFTGDVGEQELARLAAQDVGATVLKVPHHGSYENYQEAFYRRCAPQAAVISVGRDNSFGHPSATVVDYFADRGIPVYRTDLDGAVTIFSDGQSFTVHTAHEEAL